ncbi:MAG TPA: potassium channel family protein [Tepidisphaeraceae bacterium]|jgi:hypothetical protein|nr:potassium channel family protein [Tepidisphaeraceae bacterium]
MSVLAFFLGLLLILITLLDGFETILLPRRINRRFRYSRMYYRTGWLLWRRAASLIPTGRWRESALGIFGPLSMLGLFASWIVSLILGFALLHYSLSTHFLNTIHSPAFPADFTSCLYFSGTTFFTLGLGDLAPLNPFARLLTVLETGLGFGFLAITIGYLPVLYQAFSRREVTISLLDARAGSPPAAGEFLARLARTGQIIDPNPTLLEWEHWAAELLESNISFPVLAYYRSQHANQSWLAALTTMLDSSALLLTLLPPRDTYQAQLTFAMARHAAVDIALIFSVHPRSSSHPRLISDDITRLRQQLRDAGSQPIDSPEASRRLAELHGLYEPFLEALAVHFLLKLPPLLHPDNSADNWQRSAWMPRTPGIGNLPITNPDSSHFD